MSPIGLGTVKLGRAAGVKYPGAFTIPDDESVTQLLHAASEVGINLLDTAPAYGDSEERIGRLLTGSRDDWVICTKAGEEFDPQTETSRFDFSADAVTASVERSVRRLRTDRVECALLHSDGRDEWLLQDSGAWRAMERLRDRGLVRAIGISSKTPRGAQLGAAMCDVVMLTLNLREQADLPAVESARVSGCGVLVKKALASGWVAPPDASAAEASQAVDASLRFVLSQQGVSSVVIGAISLAHLKENARVAQEICER